jgi:hypothetical protein
MERLSERERMIDSLTFTGCVNVCRAAGISVEGKTMNQLRAIMKADETISLDAGIPYVKTNQITNKKETKQSASPAIINTTDLDAEKAFPELEITQNAPFVFRVENKGHGKKPISVVIRNDSTFLGAFSTKKALLKSLGDRYPGIAIDVFRSKEGHEGVRIVEFSGDELLDYERAE